MSGCQQSAGGKGTGREEKLEKYTQMLANVQERMKGLAR